jgi:ParB-like chromosome segregation protein Spo0J
MKDKLPAYKTAAVADLIPYARNSRTHSDAQVSKIAASIREFGFLNPVIVDGSSGIIAGHGRIMAAQKLGIETVPVIEASHLTDAQRRAYVIADNRLALDAGWDEEMLRVELSDLGDADFDLSLLGFDDDELARLTSSQGFEAGSQDDQGVLDQLEPKWVGCPHCGKEFDLRDVA